MALERVAKHVTENEEEQKMVINFISNLEENFHVNPYVLFQNSDYLTVIIHRNSEYENLKFYFTNQEPKIKNGSIYFNGYLSYSYTCSFSGKYLRFESWYEGPSKSSKYGGDWTSGHSFNSDTLLKIINLNDRQQFDWYQNPKQP